MVMAFPFNNISKSLTFDIVILSNVDPLNIFLLMLLLSLYIFIIIMQTSEFVKAWRS
jgi:hypothetical protein